MSSAQYKPLLNHILSIIAQNERKDMVSIDLEPSLWTHIDINPFQIASMLSKYLVQQGVFQRGKLMVKVNAVTSLLTLTFPVTVSADGQDDPDQIEFVG